MSLKCSFEVIFSITLPLLLPTLTHLKSIWVTTLYHFKHFCNLLAPRLKRPLKSLRKSSSPFKLQLHVQAVTRVTRLCYTLPRIQPSQIWIFPHMLSQIRWLLLVGDIETLVIRSLSIGECQHNGHIPDIPTQDSTASLSTLYIAALLLLSTVAPSAIPKPKEEF